MLTKQDIENELNAIKFLCQGNRCPNIVFIDQQGVTADGRHFINMELCDYILGDYIYRSDECIPQIPLVCGAPLPRHDQAGYILEIFVQIGIGVAFMHEHSHIHRDIKPQNSNFCSCRG